MTLQARFALVLGSPAWVRPVARQAIDTTGVEPAFIVLEESNGLSLYWGQLKRRWRRYGFWKLADQVLLQFYLAAIKPWKFQETGDGWLSGRNIVRVASINSAAFIEFVKKEKLDYVVCIASSIVHSRTLESVAVPMFNIHPGINPWYRGAGGNFWALFNDDMDTVGVTVHRIEPAIDSGGIVYREKMVPAMAHDSFEKVTAEAMGLGLRGVLCLLRDTPDLVDKPRPPEGEGKMHGWYGLTHYMRARSNLRNFIKQNKL